MYSLTVSYIRILCLEVFVMVLCVYKLFKSHDVVFCAFLFVYRSRSFTAIDSCFYFIYYTKEGQQQQPIATLQTE